jgi:hypothetical protein
MLRRLTAALLVALALAPAGSLAAALEPARGASGGLEFGLPDDLTTYHYVEGARDHAVDLGELFATRRAFANLPLPDSEASSLPPATRYAVVAAEEPFDLVSPVPGAALLFGTALGGLGALVWRQRHHPRLGGPAS